MRPSSRFRCALLCAALALNLWVGYFPTVQTAWNQLTAGPLPDQTDQATVVAMQQSRQIPAQGTVVPVTISPAASGFKHRGEFVYLPPAWFASNPPPSLPTLMMIGGEFNTPADWLRAGNAIKTVDDFASAHAGNAPVLVFVDSGGAFNNDTECVNGARGNAADHLTKDVVPFMEANYGVSTAKANWGIVGWSMGGTCAVDLATMHPDVFGTFEDIAGDLSPNSGTKQQTIDRLFGGNAAQYAAFDPTTVITRHGPLLGDLGMVRHQRKRRDHNASHGIERRQQRRQRTRWARHRRAAQRPDLGGELAVRAGRGQRNRLRRGRPAGQARLAVRRTRVRGGTALAGVAGRHPGSAAATAARTHPCAAVTSGGRQVGPASVVGFRGEDLGEEGIGTGRREPGPGEGPNPLPDAGGVGVGRSRRYSRRRW